MEWTHNWFKDVSRRHPTLSNTPRHTEGRDARYNVNYYYQRQADFEHEDDEEISGED